MKKRTLFVHIGPPKTGTTSIQNVLHTLAPSLEQCGVHVVVASSENGHHWNLVGRDIERQHHGVQNTRYRDRLYRWSYVLHEIVRCDAERFAMSSERFASADARRGGIRQLRSLGSSADIDVRIVGYVRPQWQWAESLWYESVRSGVELRPFEECIEGWFADQRLDFNDVFLPWLDAFGEVAVSPFETGRMPRGLLVHFLRLLGIDDERLFRAAARLPLRNPRLGAKEVEVRRMVGVALASHGVEEWRRPTVMRQLGDLARLFEQDWAFAGMRREQVSRFDAYFAESNARFAEDYGIDADGVLFHDEIPGDFDERGRPASWDDLSGMERRDVKRHVRRSLGIDIEGAGRDGNPVVVAVAKPVNTQDSAFGFPWLSRKGRQMRLFLWHALRLTRGLGQIRLSTNGILFVRWVRWEVYEFWRRRLGALPWRS